MAFIPKFLAHNEKEIVVLKLFFWNKGFTITIKESLC